MSDSASKIQLLRAAKKLVLTRGYAATTVDAICEEARLTKGSFYHFFNSKEELGAAVLRWSLESGAELLGSGPYRKEKDPVKRGLYYLQHMEDCAMSLWMNGCLLGSYALELAETHPQMQTLVSHMFRETAEAMAVYLGPLSQAAEGRLPGAYELAEQLLMVLEGAIVLAKAHRDPKRIPQAIRTFRSYVEAKLKPGS